MLIDFINNIGTFNGFTGLVAGAGVACLGKAIKAEVKAGWKAFCRFAATMHVSQHTMDTVGIAALDKAKPAIDTALEDAKASLEADLDTTGQVATVEPVQAAPLPAVAVAAVAVAQ